MNFTSADAVTAHYPGIVQIGTGRSLLNMQIDGWIESQGARIAAAISSRGYALDGLASSNPQAYALLSLLNEVGAAADLGEELLLGREGQALPAGWANPKSLRRSFENMLSELVRGTYDKLFLEEPTLR